MSLEFLKIE